MSKKLTVLAALALAIILCLGGISTVFATGGGTTPPNLGENYGNQAKASIGKHLLTSKFTKIPALTFVFEVTPQKEGDNTYVAGTPRGEPGYMPTQDDVVISYAADTTAATTTDIMDLIKQAPVLVQKDWSHAGAFQYLVTEKVGSNAALDAKHHFIVYSTAQYLLTANVKEDSAGLFYVYSFAAEVVVPDTDEEVEDKVTTDPGVNDDSSGMKFTNKYVKLNGPTDPENPDPDGPDGPGTPDPTIATLSISKTVEGDYGNKNLDFSFEVTVNANPLLANPGAESFKAYRYKFNTTSGAYDYVGFVVEIPTGSTGTKTITIRHGEKVVFFDTHVGTTYVVNELGTTNYIPRYKVFTGNVQNATGNAGTGLPLPTGSQSVGEVDNGNRVEYTNENETNPVTGLALDDLPFIGMIILAVGAIVGYVVLKSKKAKKAQAQQAE